MGLKSTTTGGGGEIIQVEGGHIIRAMGRKDRHSKVFTAKGPRDRRVRLSAHTAIQFYDVQDRLGFDRPSKAVDWLINKAKASIDELAHLPPWNPPQNYNINNNNNVGGSNSTEFPVPDRTESIYNNQDDDDDDDNGVGECMKSFFPISSTTCGEENQMSFQSYPAGVQSHQDLCLSLHTLPDDDQSPGSGTHSGHDHPVGLFPGPGSMGFDSGWAQQHDLGRFTRMMGWAGGGGERGGRGGIMFNNPSPSPPQFQQQLGYTNSNNFERGTLQSSFYPLVGHPGMGPGPGPESFMGFCNPSSQQIHQAHELLHGGGDLSNRASSSSLSPDDSSQH